MDGANFASSLWTSSRADCEVEAGFYEVWLHERWECKRSDTERGELPSSTNLIASNFSSNVLLRIWTVRVVSNFVGSLHPLSYELIKKRYHCLNCDTSSFQYYLIFMSQQPRLSNGEFLGNSIPCAENCFIIVSAHRELLNKFTGVIPIIATLIVNDCPRSICWPPILLECLAVRTNCAIPYLMPLFRALEAFSGSLINQSRARNAATGRILNLLIRLL